MTPLSLKCVAQNNSGVSGVKTWCGRDITLSNHEQRHTADRLLQNPEEDVCRECHAALSKRWDASHPPRKPFARTSRHAIWPAMVGSLFMLLSVFPIALTNPRQYPDITVAEQQMGHYLFGTFMILSLAGLITSVVIFKRAMIKNDRQWKDYLKEERELNDRTNRILLQGR